MLVSGRSCSPCCTLSDGIYIVYSDICFFVSCLTDGKRCILFLQMLQNLTVETKRQRYIAEEREASLYAHVATLRLEVEQSMRECRHEKISTWGTVARESERAAGRER